jgi:hypothetical protein
VLLNGHRSLHFTFLTSQKEVGGMMSKEDIIMGEIRQSEIEEDFESNYFINYKQFVTIMALIL